MKAGGSIVGRVGGTVAMLTLVQAAVLLTISIAAFRSQVAVARVHLVEEGIALALLASEPHREGETVAEHLDRLAPLQGFAIALYDADGALLHATRDDVERLASLDRPLRERAAARPGEAIIVRGSPDEPTAALAALLPGSATARGEARYLGLFEENSAHQVARGRLYVFVALSVGVVLFVLLMTAWLTRRARASLREIEAVVHRMADGDLSVRLPVRSDDEVGRVVGDFNRMADSLAQRLEELRRAEAQRSRTEAQRSRLFAAFTHELSTPLTSVLGYLESLRMSEIDGDPDTRHRYVEIAYTQARALDALAEDLSTLSRLDFEGLPLSRSHVDLGALARAELAPFEPRAADKRVTLSLETEGDLAADVDAQRVGQVLRVLLDNALRHTADGSQIAVRLARLDTDRASLVVQDGGPGVPEEHLDRLGEPLYRLDASRARGTGGRGLGLSIARGIARAHGGELTFTSPPGSGLVATVTLPLRERPSEPEPP
ncbi:MAG: HAMP domain-containing histidine kinase [Sandaracinaceae bacterium]|nr:HAMP domain-containing histidine kinase [Sandaracinaceae bacterium]